MLFYTLLELVQILQVEAWEMEDGTVNIRISCIYKPAILVSIMKAFDILGLDIHQATISCFNGFAIDVYKVEVYIYFSYPCFI